MTDKERLEEIKNSYSVGVHIFFGTPRVAIPKENFEWLIEQSEKSIKYYELLHDIANLAYYKEQDAEYYEGLLKQLMLFARNALEG